MRVALTVVLLALLLLPASIASPTAFAADCQFVLGFQALHNLIPNVVGTCLVDEHHNATNGDGLQETTGPTGGTSTGLLVWRKTDNWTAYTDGYHTWVNGPYGLQERLNTERFPWERDPLPTHGAQGAGPVATVTWAPKAPMPTGRDDLGVATLNGKIYAIGGAYYVYRGQWTASYLNTVEEYNPATNTWAAKAPMPTPRHNLRVVAVNGKIYAFGGEGTVGGSIAWLATVETYDPATNTWTTKRPMPLPCESFGATTGLNGKIYVIGGHGGCAVTDVREYDPLADTWAKRASMATPRDGVQAVTTSGGKIFAIGGSCWPGQCTAVDEYDPATDSWRSHQAKMAVERIRLGAVLANNGRIYTIGGYYNWNWFATVEEYDPVTDSWSTKASMPTARDGLGVVLAANGKIYAFGGHNKDGQLATVEEATIQ